MPRIPRIGRQRAQTPRDPPAPSPPERRRDFSVPFPQDAAGQTARHAEATATGERTPPTEATATRESTPPVAVAAAGSEATAAASPPPAVMAETAAAVPGAVVPDADLPAGQDPAATDRASFNERGRIRRRLRFLRRARELAFRDLGGLVFDMHRFGRQREDLVGAKVATLARIDGELRALQTALGERRPLTVLREPGIAACPRCAAIHGTDARFCPSCGLPLGRHHHRPMTGPSDESLPSAAPDEGSAPALEATPGTASSAGVAAQTPPVQHPDEAPTTSFSGAGPPGGSAQRTS